MRVRLLRIRRRLIAIAIIFAFVLYLLRVSLKSREDSKENSTVLCEHTPESRQKFVNLVSRSKEALSSLRLDYFLCYNSLWGALKRREVFPWFSSVEWCVLNEEIANHDEAFIFRTFKREGLNIEYSSSDGTYTVTTFNETQPSLKLIIFEENPQTNQYRRIGWKNRLIPPDSCTLIHCFPPRLIEKPLETVNFMESEIPVPREEIEILKYLFPDDWWKDSEPDICKGVVNL